jgi:hypothetical protein
MGLSMLHEMSFQRDQVANQVSSHLTPFLLLLCTCVYIKNWFWKLAERYKCAQPIGEIFPTPSLSLCSGGG